MVTAIIGSQFGDEGKGRIVDWFCQHRGFRIVARFQGGPNAGHTVVANGKTYILHQIPTGILNPKIRCVMGNGMVIDLALLRNEIETLKKAGISVEDRLFISTQAHLIFPYHLLLEKLSEKEKGSQRIGSTLRGIGPTYTDKYTRTGIRAGYLLYPQLFQEKLAAVIEEKNRVLRDIYGLSESELFDPAKLAQEYLEISQPLLPFITDTVSYLYEMIGIEINILIEGAQGTFLDIDQGTYPYVTSSSTTAAGACTGLGISPESIDEIFLVVKAYITRVGEGPLVTRMEPEVEEKVREWGGEFGATTGRPRNCGWLDGVLLKRAVMINRPDALVLTKLDVLTRLREIRMKPIIVTSYSLDDEKIDEKSLPSEVELLAKCRMGNKTEFGSWDKLGKTFDDFPPSAKEYMQAIEKITGVPINLISTGPEREAMVEK